MMGRDVDMYLRGIQSRQETSLQLIIRRCRVAAQPGTNGLLTNEQLPKSISGYLTVVGISTRCGALLQPARQVGR